MIKIATQILKKIKIKPYILVFFIFNSIAFSLLANQDPYQDSLIQILKTTDNNYQKIEIYYDLINDYYYIDSVAKGDFYLNELENLVEQNDEKLLKGCLFIIKSYKYHFIQNKITEAIKFGVEGINFLRETADTTASIRYILTDALNETGFLLEKAGLYDKALNHYLEGIELVKHNENKSIELTLYNDISFLYSEYFGDVEKGIEYLEKALKIAKEEDDWSYIDELNGNLAGIYGKIGDFNKAKIYINKAIAISNQEQDTFNLAYNYLEKAKLYLKQNDLKNAQETINLSLALSLKPCTWCDEIYSLIGEIAEKEGDLEKAENFYQLANENIMKYPNLSKHYKTLINLANLIKKRGKLSEASNYYAQAFVLKDSLDRNWKIANVIRTQTEAELKIIEKEKEVLEFNRQLLVVKVQAQRRFILLISLLFMIALVSGIWIFIQKKKLFKSYQLLVKKNQELIQHIQEKTRGKLKLSKKKTKGNLSKELEEQLLKNLEKALMEEKVFQNKNLTLTSFAQLLGTNTSYLSKFINSHYNKRFNTLINEFRVKEVLLYFETEELEKLTIFALAQKAGFSSKSAFNTAFKEYTGVTPSFYLKNKLTKEE